MNRESTDNRAANAVVRTAPHGAESAADVLVALVRRFLPLHRLGWAFLLAWVFCVFYTDAVNGYLGSDAEDLMQVDIASTLLYLMVPLGSTVITLLVIIFGERRFGSPDSHLPVVLAAPIISAVGTPLLFNMAGPIALQNALFFAGAVLVGVGSALLWVMWGSYYTHLDHSDIEFCAPVSAIIAILLVFTVSSIDGALSLVIATSFPLISGVCLIFALRADSAGAPEEGRNLAARQLAHDRNLLDKAHEGARRTPFSALRTMGRVGIGIFLTCMAICIGEEFWLAAHAGTPLFRAMLLAAAALVIIVALSSTRAARHVSMVFLFRWMCPLLLFAYACLIWGYASWGTPVAATISFASRFAFFVMTQMYFAYFASSGRVTPTQSYGFGWLFVHLGDFAGVVFAIVLGSYFTPGSETPTGLCAGLMLAIACASMVVVGIKENFSGAGVSTSPAARETMAAEVCPPANAVVNAVASVRDEATDLQTHCAELAVSYSLTPREQEVLALLAQGRSVPYIRDELVISRDTAATHVKHIYAKLGVHSKQELLDLFQ